MSRDQIEARIAELRAAPPHVKKANFYAVLFGAAWLLRGLATAYAGNMPWGNAVLFGLLIVALCWYWGLSLLGRGRWSFILLMLFAGVPVVFLLAMVVRLVRPFLEGQLEAPAGDMAIGVAALCQLLAGGMLLRHLFATQTWDHVWKGKERQRFSREPRSRERGPRARRRLAAERRCHFSASLSISRASSRPSSGPRASSATTLPC